MSHYHAVVWIDHQKGTVWQFSSTEHEFAHYLQDRHAALARGIVAVENADHPSDAQVLAYALRHFAAIDRIFAAETHPGH